jgi:hypothetical protein
MLDVVQANRQKQESTRVLIGHDISGLMSTMTKKEFSVVHLNKSRREILCITMPLCMSRFVLSSVLFLCPEDLGMFPRRNRLKAIL